MWTLEGSAAVTLPRVVRCGRSPSRRTLRIEGFVYRVRRPTVPLHHEPDCVNDAKLIVGSMAQPVKPSRNQQLFVLLHDAARAQAFALAKPKLSLTELASKFGRSPERFKRLVRLSYLSPKIVKAILQGHQPPHLTGRALQHLEGCHSVGVSRKLCC